MLHHISEKNNISAIKHGAGSVTIWGSYAASEPGGFEVLTEKSWKRIFNLKIE